MAKYKLCENHKDGISFNDIQKEACGGILREIAYEMFIAGFMHHQHIENIDVILEIAERQSNIEWLVSKRFIETIQPVYHLGQIFENLNGYKYILCQTTSRHICLMNLKDGNRLIDPIAVQDVDHISGEEFMQACSGQRASFAEVENA